MSEIEYEYGVAAPPFFIRKQKGRPLDVLVQKAAGLSLSRIDGNDVIEAMAKRIGYLEQAAGAYEVAVVDRNVICKLGELLLGSGKQCYSAEAVHRAIAYMVAQDPTYFAMVMDNFRQRLREEVMNSTKMFQGENDERTERR